MHGRNGHFSDLEPSQKGLHNAQHLAVRFGPQASLALHSNAEAARLGVLDHWPPRNGDSALDSRTHTP